MPCVLARVSTDEEFAKSEIVRTHAHRWDIAIVVYKVPLARNEVQSQYMVVHYGQKSVCGVSIRVQRREHSANLPSSVY